MVIEIHVQVVTDKIDKEDGKIRWELVVWDTITEDQVDNEKYCFDEEFDEAVKKLKKKYNPQAEVINVG